MDPRKRKRNKTKEGVKANTKNKEKHSKKSRTKKRKMVECRSSCQGDKRKGEGRKRKKNIMGRRKD